MQTDAELLFEEVDLFDTALTQALHQQGCQPRG
jgi:hypothetical protein